MPYKVILFDIDGTLCDPGPSMIESARYALEQLGHPSEDEKSLRRLIGPPLEHAFRDNYGFDDETTNKAVFYFREKLQKDGIKLYTCYGGISELLKNLHSNKKELAIVTSKIEHIAKDALKNTGILQYFEVIGAQHSNEVVQKEVILSRVLDELGVINKSEVVMIGDRKHDIEAANAQGVDSIGVLWGYGDREEIQAEKPSYIVETVAELTKLLV